jgi:CDGSH-type Zn-finger protein/truncated hemoglobin YjbI
MSALEQQLVSLKDSASSLAVELRAQGDEKAERVAQRLCESVVRPLEQFSSPEPEPAETRPDEQTPGSAGSIDAGGATPAPLPDQIWALARTATELLAKSPDVAALGEATAALQDLALTLVDDSTASSHLADLQALQASLPQRIQVAKDGPYLVKNARALTNWLGEPLPIRPQMALCRCGASQIKPFCDGAHASTGFSDAKDPNRVPDRRDTYPGQQITILDNRGLCQHSGFCTDRLATVFRQDQEPFVAPSGGRMDEIIRAVRDCPSGALSYAIDGIEARQDVDYHGTREPAIMVSKDGPYRITGGIPLHDASGGDVARNQGASHEHYALCRCGHSQNKPFCSGMHWYVDFRDPIPDSERTPTVFEWVGGYPALLRMTRLFYEKHIPGDPLLAPLFANMAVDHPERVASWLAEVFGGPKTYSTNYGGYTRMISQHLGKGITEEKRQRWVTLLKRAAEDAGIPNDPEFASVFNSYIEWGSRLAVENSTAGAHPPEHMPMPHWEWNTASGPPGSRVSALAPAAQEEDAPIVLPAVNEPLHFDRYIKPLFRERDRQSMSFAFDLWSYDDVSKYADAILARLRSGTMPCDGAWPAERIDVFQRWIDAGKPR